MKIATIIITCNRMAMLGRLLESLMRQSRKPEGIIVIDNNSKDGTVNFVETCFPFVQLIKLKRNIGLYGGLEIGIKTAISQGYDAVWLVDDDAWLMEDTLEHLLHAIDSNESLKESIVYCAHVAPDGQFFTEPVQIIVEGTTRTYLEFTSELKGKIYETSGGPNIGVYIPRCIIECVGAPRSDMVFCGEWEYLLRVKKAGFKVFHCFSSIVYHKRHNFVKVKLLWKTWYIPVVPPWHIYYELRNNIYIARAYKTSLLLKTLLFVAIIFVIKLYTCENKLSTAVYMFRAVYDGLLGRLGMRVEIPR